MIVRLATAYVCPVAGCDFSTDWPPAVGRHKQKHDGTARLTHLHNRDRAHDDAATAPTTTPRPRESPPAPRGPRVSTLSEEEVERIATRVAERCITNRQHRLLRSFGMVPLTGRLEFIVGKDGTIEARVDGHDVAKLLRITFPEGARVSVLFADADALEGRDPAGRPAYGTVRETYNQGPLSDPRRNKPPREAPV